MSHKDDINPYASPKAETIINPNAENATGYRVEKKLVAVQDGAKLPRICFLTGEEVPSAIRTRLPLYWINPAWLLLILVFWPAYVIVYYCVRKKVTFDYCISQTARKNRRAKKLIYFSTFIICVLATIICFTLTDHNQVYFGYGVIGAIISTIIFFVACNVNARIIVRKHKHGWFYITGAGKNFLREAQNQL